MKVGPPGWREHMTMNRLDGFVGGDPSHVSIEVAGQIVAAMPPPRGRTEVEIIRARMLRRQLDYNHAKRVRLARRRKSGLEAQ
jgi:hypothetical protein